jgi:2-iminobutanoate/2-iminopropanoate deaminase
MADFPLMNQAYAAFFPDRPPARSTLAARALPAGGKVEIDAVGTTAG